MSLNLERAKRDGALALASVDPVWINVWTRQDVVVSMEQHGNLRDAAEESEDWSSAYAARGYTYAYTLQVSPEGIIALDLREMGEAYRNQSRADERELHSMLGAYRGVR